MKIVEINSFGNLSTGKIACQYARKYASLGNECVVVYGRGDIPSDVKSYKIGNKFSLLYHAFMSRIFGKTGRYSKHQTKRLVKWLKEYKPDLVHIHNLHGYYLNYDILFKYLKESNVKVEWTLHDCWAFTGHCAFFLETNCEKWKTKCEKCPLLNTYPKSIIDSSKNDYIFKRNVFTSLESKNVKIITPSKWLANLIKESFLGKYETIVEYNTINENVFKPRKSDILSKHFKSIDVEQLKIVLGVASTWDERKGLSDFIKLSKLVNHDNEYVILIGLSSKQITMVEKYGIIGIGRTSSQEELAEYYSSAYCFFNPTKGDNYPTVNLEAQACGTHVLTYDTGGCSETDRGNLSIVKRPEEVIDYLRK